MLLSKEVPQLIRSIDTEPIVGVRDYAIIATLIGTAARAGAVARLKVGNLKHDGSQHHGIGIQPTIPVSRTLTGVKEGRDEILEAGIAVVTGKAR